MSNQPGMGWPSENVIVDARLPAERMRRDDRTLDDGLAGECGWRHCVSDGIVAECGYPPARR